MTKRFLIISILLGLCCAYNIQAQYMVTTIAGNGLSGWTGTGGPATSAAVNRPYSVFFEHSTGNIYFTPAEGARMVNASGIMVDVAGSGVNGYSGNGGPATAALLREPRGITKDAAGNIFIADNQNYVIRKINPASIITTFAGTNTLGYSGEGGPASAASLAGIASIRFEQGNLYLAVAGYNRICKIDAAGIVTTVAGTGAAGFSGDGGPATAAQLWGPGDMTFDNSGNMYISDGTNARIRKVSTSGIITTIAGTGISGFNGDNRPATSANINPAGIAVNQSGEVFFAEQIANRIRKITPTGIITTIAGSGIAGFRDDSCVATAGQFKHPGGIFLDTATGVIYIADLDNYRIRKLIPDYIPKFISGNQQQLYICRDTLADSLNVRLRIKDTDTGQVLNWTVVLPPAHGAFAGSYSAIATGGVIVPVGLYYKPAVGYCGTDTFKVAVSDCTGGSDTATIYVYIDTAVPNSGFIIGKDTVCIGDTILLSITSGGSGAWASWYALNTKATVAAGTVTGLTAGIDTIMYTVTDGCGSDTALPHRVVVKPCLNEITSPKNVDEGDAMRVWPSPNHGSFTVNFSSRKDRQIQVNITDIAGRVIKQLTLTTNKDTVVELNRPGMYFITAITEAGKSSRKIVVQ